METPEFLKKVRKEENDFLKAPIYLYGTEAIGSYYKALDLKDKSVLAVNGSGDQVLNAYYFGAKKVIGFDLVKNTRYMLDLKVAAIKELDRKEFLEFFGDKNGLGSFSHETFSSLEKYLEDDTIEFFDSIFKDHNYNGRELLRSDSFRTREEFYKKLDEINPFLTNDKNYNKMREVLPKIKPTFIESDIKDIHKKVEGTFDIINLSNVLNYVSREYVKTDIANPIEAVYNEAILNLKKKLSDDGKIIFYGFYRAPKQIDTMPPINRESTIKWIAKQGDFKTSRIDFGGILSGEDFVRVLEKA